MACPDCASTATTRRKGRTALGYRRFRCQACRRRFNERTGTPFNDLQYPTDIVLLAVRWCSLYRAIDREGVLLDSMLSEHRDKHAARRFLRRCASAETSWPGSARPAGRAGIETRHRGRRHSAMRS